MTTNLINGKFYIGKHQSSKYDNNYYGSGTNIIRAIKKYGKNNFVNEIIEIAYTIEELNEKEKYYIKHYKDKYPDNCYNIALGGDGGDTFSKKTEEEKKLFKEEMTRINRERCSSEDFKEKLSIAGKKRYSDPEERKKQSIKIKESWSNVSLKDRQSEKLKEYFKENPKDNSYLNIACVFNLNEETIEFKSLKDLKIFLAEEYDYHPGNRKIKELLNDGKNGIPYEPKKKLKTKIGKLKGMIIFKK